MPANNAKPLGSILPGGEQIMGFDDAPIAAPAVDADALGSWVKALPKEAPAKAATAPPAAPVADDPLGAWAKSVSSVPASSPVPLPVARPSDAGPSAVTPPADPTQETLPQAINRWTAEAHGHGDPSLSTLITGKRGDSWGDWGVQAGAGVLRGMGDVADTLGQGIASGVGGGANILANHGYLSPGTNAAIQNWRAGVNQGIATDQGGFDAAAGDSALSATGRLGGNVLASAPLIAAGGGALSAATRGAPIVQAVAARPVLSSVLKGAGAGAAANALTSSTSSEPLWQQIESGAGAGAVLGPLGYGAAKLGSKLFSGAVDRETAQLAQSARDQHGIPVTGGQISSNPTVRFMDSVLQRLPFSGYAARTAEQQAALNRAVAGEMGVAADKITPNVVRQAKSTAYNDYDAAKASMGPMKLDGAFYKDLSDVHSNAHYNLEPALASNIDNHLRNVISKIDPVTHTLDPDLYQSLTRKGGPLDKAINSPDSKIATYASDIKDSMESLLGRNDPALKALKDKADYKYFVAKSVEPMSLESPTGDVSPAKLLRAVDNSSTAVGDVGRIAKRFLKEPPSSGTAERLMIMQHLPQLATGALGVGGLAGATAFDPESWQRNALLGVGAIGLARAGSAALRSNALANSMIRSGLRAGPGGAQKAFNLLPPALASGGALVSRPTNIGTVYPQTP